MQEALVRVARSWKTFRREAEFRTWLFRIVINVFAATWPPLPIGRRLCPKRWPTGEWRIRPGPQNRELAELIAERVSALPERQREVMVLTSFEGFSVQEAAKLLEITEANVYSTLAVARHN